MVELSGLAPAFGGVTNSALRSETTFMLIFLRVTGIAVLIRGLQVGKIARVNVTLGTDCQGVNANQREFNFVVIKVRAVGVNAIVTCLAVRPKGQDVFLGKYLIDI